MKVFYRISFCLSVVLLTTGCSRQMSFDELTKNIPSSINTHTYSSAKMSYNISLLDRFKFIDQEYNDTLSFELFVDTSMVYEQGASVISILKYKSTETSLDQEWKKLSSKRQLIQDFKIYSKGLTDYLPESSYYEHSGYTINNKNAETISFLFHGEDATFYLISLEVIKEEDYPDNMRELLYCVKTIKILP